MSAPFDWEDGERRIHFGSGRVDEAVALAGGPGFLLLTTERAVAQAAHVADAALDVVHVPRGKVDEVAGALLDEAALSPSMFAAAGEGVRIVALGGGRVVDVAKAVVAARRAGLTGEGGQGGDPQVVAVPTTLSGAEMTRGHRHALGVDPKTPRVRPAVVIADPSLMASQSLPDLAASALNALGHAVEGPLTPKASPVPTLAARDGARLLVRAFDDDEPDRDAAALGAILAGYAIDSQGYGLHHVMAQTIVRAAGIGHGPGNSVLLPHTTRALRERFPERLTALDTAIGEPSESAFERLCALTGASTLSALGVDADTIERAAGEAARRPDLASTPPAATRDELLSIYRAAC